MELRVLLRQCLSAIRDFAAPRYRPELHYMRGPGAAYERRAVWLNQDECCRSCASRRHLLLPEDIQSECA